MGSCASGALEDGAPELVERVQRRVEGDRLAWTGEGGEGGEGGAGEEDGGGEEGGEDDDGFGGF